MRHCMQFVVRVMQGCTFPASCTVVVSHTAYKPLGYMYFPISCTREPSTGQINGCKIILPLRLEDVVEKTLFLFELWKTWQQMKQ